MPSSRQCICIARKFCSRQSEGKTVRNFFTKCHFRHERIGMVGGFQRFSKSKLLGLGKSHCPRYDAEWHCFTGKPIRQHSARHTRAASAPNSRRDPPGFQRSVLNQACPMIHELNRMLFADTRPFRFVEPPASCSFPGADASVLSFTARSLEWQGTSRVLGYTIQGLGFGFSSQDSSAGYLPLTKLKGFLSCWSDAVSVMTDL